MALDVSALSDFNNEVAGELIAKMVYGGSTMEYVTIKEGVKFQEPINLMEVDLVLQNGTCVSTPSGSLDFSQRNITVCPRTSFDGICLKDMDRTYLGIAALERGSYNETFALATNYSELLVNQFQKSNDQFLWTAVSGSSPAGCSSDGLKLIISGSTTGVTAVASTPLTASTALTQLDDLIEAIPSDVAAANLRNLSSLSFRASSAAFCSVRSRMVPLMPTVLSFRWIIAEVISIGKVEPSFLIPRYSPGGVFSPLRIF